MSDTLELLHQLDKRIDRTIETMGNLERENINLKATISKMEITTLELKSQIEKMKNDVYANIKWADQNKNNQMWQKLIKMMNEWELAE